MHYSKLLAASLSAGLLMSTPLAAAHEIDDSDYIKQTHDLSGFTDISIEGVFELDVQVGEGFSVKTSGRPEDVEHMDVYVKNGTLVLATDDKKKNWNLGKKNNNHGIRAMITLPSLEAVEVAGIATGKVSGIDAERFEIETAGISNVTYEGRCGQLEMEQAGLGQTDASELKCEDVNVDLAGMGELKVYASKSVDADAAGMGKIEVYGNPEDVRKSSNFMAKVKIK